MFSWFKKEKRIGKGKKVFVGVSGGVDSSVSAALLLEQGYDVVGVFIRTWQPDWIECTWRDERRDAMRVCAHLNIPFVELDLEQEYKQGVADYMIREYRSGRTPNPDVMCNREVKFGGFLKWALAHGADYVATGHYARVSCKTSEVLRSGAKPSANVCSAAEQTSEVAQLMKGIDPSKDQSYFLWTLTNEQLSHVLFPIGYLQKSEVRTLAEKFKLPTATKKDSQGICFIGDIDMKEFLRHYIDIKPGDVLNEEGSKIGTHDGALFYTLGERHGFVISEKTPNDAPYYVIAKNVERNTIMVSQSPNRREKNREIILQDFVWRIVPQKNTKYEAQIRYHGDPKPCELAEREGTWAVNFDESDFSISSGQSVVVYDGDICIGGGVVA